MASVIDGDGERRGGAAVLRVMSRNPLMDLIPRTALPLPRLHRPRWAAFLPHALVVVFAVLMVRRSHQYLLDEVSSLLVVIEAAVLVVALFQPVLAWWASLAIMVVAVQAAKLPESAALPGMAPGLDAGTTRFPEGVLRGFAPGMDAGVTLPWTVPGIGLQAGVLFLLALRVRPRALVTALTITVLTALTCVSFSFRGLDYNAGPAILGFSVAALVGATLHSREVVRSRLVVQEELTAEERARRALLEERTRIARELHDVVAHHMSVVSIQAQVAPHLAENPSPELRENLENIRRNAVDALSELRRVLGVLRAEDDHSEAAGHDPQPTLERLAGLLANVRSAGIEAELRTTGTPVPLPAAVELSAYRIVQEALSNALRHAPGSTVRVEVGHGPKTLTVRIVNTASERPAPPSPGAGHGLLGMRERAAVLDGELTAGHTADGGYEVMARLPVGRPSPELPGADRPRPRPADLSSP